MRPGLTASPSWHKAGDLFSRGEETRKVLLLIWTVLGFITGGAVLQTGADLVSTSATGDGSVMSTSSWITGDSLITGRILGTGLTSIVRESETGTSPSSYQISHSDGPLLIGEYVSIRQKSRDQPTACIFGNNTRPPEEMTLEASGIIRNGNYSRMQTLHTGESYITADGTGVMDFRHRLTGNGSISGRTQASGNLSVSEHIRTDQGDSP